MSPLNSVFSYVIVSETHWPGQISEVYIILYKVNKYVWHYMQKASYSMLFGISSVIRQSFFSPCLNMVLGVPVFMLQTANLFPLYISQDSDNEYSNMENSDPTAQIVQAELSFSFYRIYSAIRVILPLEWLQITKSVRWSFAIIQVSPFLNNPKDLDPSYEMDLDFWHCFKRKKKLCLIIFHLGQIEN